MNWLSSVSHSLIQLPVPPPGKDAHQQLLPSGGDRSVWLGYDTILWLTSIYNCLKVNSLTASGIQESKWCSAPEYILHMGRTSLCLLLYSQCPIPQLYSLNDVMTLKVCNLHSDGPCINYDKLF